jgi:hypothetical protein
MLPAKFRRPEQVSVNQDFPASMNLFSGIFDYLLGNQKMGRQT